MDFHNIQEKFKIVGFFLTLSVGVIVLIFTYKTELYGMKIRNKIIREPNNLHRFKTSFIVFWVCINNRNYNNLVNMKSKKEFFQCYIQE